MSWRSLLVAFALVTIEGAAQATGAPNCTGYTDIQRDPMRPANLAQIKATLDGGAAVDPIDGGYSRLQFAAGDGDVALTRLLLARGANTEYRDHNKDRALLWASRYGRVETVKILLDAGSPIQSDNDPYQITPLMIAVTSGHLGTACLLITRGADVNRVDHTNETALLDAASSNDPRMIDILLRAGANPNLVSEHIFETPLLVAAKYGRTDTIRVLLRTGANMDARNYQGETPMWRTANRGNTEALAILLAEPSPRGRAAKAQRQVDKNHAFVISIWSPIGDGGPLLVDKGASINAMDTVGRSAFAGVSRFPGTIMFDWFIRRGVNVNLHGNSALLEAARVGRTDIVNKLLAGKVPVDGRNPTGLTALMASAGQGQVETVRVLLAAGADPSLLDTRGNGVEFFMTEAVDVIETKIRDNKASRAFRPTNELEQQLAALRRGHSFVRTLIDERTVQ